MATSVAPVAVACWELRVLSVARSLLSNACAKVEESNDDALNSLDAFWGERRAVGFYMDELGGLAKNNFVMTVRRELALGGHGVLVPGADVEDITWHGEVARAFGVNCCSSI